MDGGEAPPARAQPVEDRAPHPLTARLLAENPVFQRHPVCPAPPHRAQLPYLAGDGPRINIWSLLKNHIGQDFWRITMPIELNEPMSMLQKTAEVLEFAHLLRAANACEDSLDRLAQVMAFFYSVIPYSIQRLKKPFNPLLGETFELVEGDLRFLVEQVSHHPPVAAFHGESDDFVLFGHLRISLSVSLSGLVVSTGGPLRVTLKRTGETFSYARTKTSLNNLVMGSMYLWHFGPAELLNETTGERFLLDFKQKGWLRGSKPLCDGSVLRADGSVAFTAKGKWSHYLKISDAKGVERTLFVKPGMPPDAEKMYNFSAFCVNLNHLTPEALARVPPTDSRLRPDQRAYEFGSFALAAEEKARLETRQRQRRAEAEKAGAAPVPQWFEQLPGEGDLPDYRFNGRYFQARETGLWPADTPDLFNAVAEG